MHWQNKRMDKERDLARTKMEIKNKQALSRFEDILKQYQNLRSIAMDIRRKHPVDLSLLRRVRKLRALSLDDMDNVPCQVYESLSQLRQLRALSFDTYSRESMHVVCTAMPWLQSFTLTTIHPIVPWSDIQTSMPNLEELYVKMINAGVGFDDWHVILSMRQLRKLRIQVTEPISTQELRAFRGTHPLQELDLSYADLESVSRMLFLLQVFPDLESLTLGPAHVLGKHFFWRLQQFPRLKHLSLECIWWAAQHDYPISTIGLSPYLPLESLCIQTHTVDQQLFEDHLCTLRHLELWTQVNSRSLVQTLSSLKNLESLKFRTIDDPDTCIRLEDMPRLKTCRLHYSTIELCDLPVLESFKVRADNCLSITVDSTPMVRTCKVTADSLPPEHLQTICQWPLYSFDLDVMNPTGLPEESLPIISLPPTLVHFHYWPFKAVYWFSICEPNTTLQYVDICCERLNDHFLKQLERARGLCFFYVRCGPTEKLLHGGDTSLRVF